MPHSPAMFLNVRSGTAPTLAMAALPRLPADKHRPPTKSRRGSRLRAGVVASDLLAAKRRGLSLLRDLVPAGDDLPAGQELLAYGAAVKRAWKAGKIQGPMAHPCAAGLLNR